MNPRSIFNFEARDAEKPKPFSRYALEELCGRYIRRDLLPVVLHEETCWCVILELFLAGGEPVPTKDLEFAAGIAGASVLRALDRLVDAALVYRAKDKRDGRVTLNMLTERGRQHMSLYFAGKYELDRVGPKKASEIVQTAVKRLILLGPRRSDDEFRAEVFEQMMRDKSADEK